MTTLELNPTYEEEVSPAEYIRIFKNERDNIDSAQIVPPKLGQKGFGRIIIIRKTPIYKTRTDKSLRK